MGTLSDIKWDIFKVEKTQSYLNKTKKLIESVSLFRKIESSKQYLA